MTNDRERELQSDPAWDEARRRMSVGALSWDDSPEAAFTLGARWARQQPPEPAVQLGTPAEYGIEPVPGAGFDVDEHDPRL